MMFAVPTSRGLQLQASPHTEHREQSGRPGCGHEHREPLWNHLNAAGPLGWRRHLSKSVQGEQLPYSEFRLGWSISCFPTINVRRCSVGFLGPALTPHSLEKRRQLSREDSWTLPTLNRVDAHRSRKDYRFMLRLSTTEWFQQCRVAPTATSLFPEYC